MLNIKPEYLRQRALRLRRSAMNLGTDPDAQRIWQLADDMETLALEMEQRVATPPRQPPRPSESVPLAG